MNFSEMDFKLSFRGLFLALMFFCAFDCLSQEPNEFGEEASFHITNAERHECPDSVTFEFFYFGESPWIQWNFYPTPNCSITRLSSNADLGWFSGKKVGVGGGVPGVTAAWYGWGSGELFDDFCAAEGTVRDYDPPDGGGYPWWYYNDPTHPNYLGTGPPSGSNVRFYAIQTRVVRIGVGGVNDLPIPGLGTTVMASGKVQVQWFIPETVGAETIRLRRARVRQDGSLEGFVSLSAEGNTGTFDDPVPKFPDVYEYRISYIVDDIESPESSAILYWDRDNDGLGDSWEIRHGLDPDDNGSALVDNGPAGDVDRDGVSNLIEFQIGASPVAADTDEDGAPDWFEIARATNPLDGLDRSLPDAYVGESAPGEIPVFSSLQGAVSALSGSAEPVWIQVDRGDRNGGVSISGGRWVISGAGARATSLEAAGLESVIAATGNAVVWIADLRVKGQDPSAQSAVSGTNSTIDLSRCWITDSGFGAVDCRGGNLTVRDSLFTDNASSVGARSAGVTVTNGKADLFHSTFVVNRDGGAGATRSIEAQGTSIVNAVACVFWNDVDVISKELRLGGGVSGAMVNCLVSGLTESTTLGGIPLAECTGAEPGISSEGRFELTSPLIDGATRSRVLGHRDLLGNRRWSGLKPDIGAVEWQHQAGAAYELTLTGLNIIKSAPGEVEKECCAVLVSDFFGKPVKNASVEFLISSGQGALIGNGSARGSRVVVRSDEAGLARVGFAFPRLYPSETAIEARIPTDTKRLSAVTTPPQGRPLTLNVNEDGRFGLNWQGLVPADIAALGITGIVVERSPFQGGGFQTVASLAPGASTFVDAGAEFGRNYFYRLRFELEDGTIAPVGEVFAADWSRKDDEPAPGSGVPYLPRNWRLAHFGSLAPTPEGDADGDGLSNWLEYQAGSDPNSDDTDLDGILDGVESYLVTASGEGGGRTVSGGLLIPSSSEDEIWVDDSVPAESVTGSNAGKEAQQWQWTGDGGLRQVSGSRYHSALQVQKDGAATHYFALADSPEGLDPEVDLLVAYVYLDPDFPPEAINLQIMVPSGGGLDEKRWDYSSTWGKEAVRWNGSHGRYMGEIPKLGVWRRLEIPLRSLSGAGSTSSEPLQVSGISFQSFGGKAHWDYVGFTKDTDEDKLPDEWERRNELVVGSDDAEDDADEDELSNLLEFAKATDPNAEDTDGDTHFDGVEVASNYDPLDPRDPMVDLTHTPYVVAPHLVASMASLASSLSAYYEMTEGRGLTMFDRSGNGNHGKLVHGAKWAYRTNNEGVLRFDGDKGRAEIPDRESLRMGGEMSISTWFYANEEAGDKDRLLFSNKVIPKAPEGIAMSYEYYSDQLTIWCQGSQRLLIHGAGLRDSWNHVLLNFEEQADLTTKLEVYINGRIVAIGPEGGEDGVAFAKAKGIELLSQELGESLEIASVKIERILESGKTLVLGGGTGLPHFLGAIDRFRVYEVALAPDQARNLTELDFFTRRPPRDCERVTIHGWWSCVLDLDLKAAFEDIAPNGAILDSGSDSTRPEMFEYLPEYQYWRGLIEYPTFLWAEVRKDEKFDTSSPFWYSYGDGAQSVPKLRNALELRSNKVVTFNETPRSVFLRRSPEEPDALKRSMPAEVMKASRIVPASELLNDFSIMALVRRDMNNVTDFLSVANPGNSVAAGLGIRFDGDDLVLTYTPGAVSEPVIGDLDLTGIDVGFNGTLTYTLDGTEPQIGLTTGTTTGGTTDGSSTPDLTDTDGDGYSDYLETIHGTDPLNGEITPDINYVIPDAPGGAPSGILPGANSIELARYPDAVGLWKWSLVTIVVESDGHRVYVDGNEVGTKFERPFNLGIPTRLGGVGFSVAELAYFDGVLTEEERYAYEYRIRAKHGLPIPDTELDDDELPDVWELSHFGTLSLSGDGDPDGDGLSNWEEFQLGTNPLLKDSDYDGLDDFAEHRFLKSNPLSVDTDGDGMPDLWELENGLELKVPNEEGDDADADTLSDIDEFRLGSHPGLVDGDGDQIPDWWELRRGLNPRAKDATFPHRRLAGRTEADLFEDLRGRLDLSSLSNEAEKLSAVLSALPLPDGDGDGLVDLVESLVLSNPADPDYDQDGDGVPDASEFYGGTNPVVRDADADADADFLTSREESDAGTNQARRDSDGDGLDDSWEFHFGFSPVDVIPGQGSEPSLVGYWSFDPTADEFGGGSEEGDVGEGISVMCPVESDLGTAIVRTRVDAMPGMAGYSGTAIQLGMPDSETPDAATYLTLVTPGGKVPRPDSDGSLAFWLTADLLDFGKEGEAQIVKTQTGEILTQLGQFRLHSDEENRLVLSSSSGDNEESLVTQVIMEGNEWHHIAILNDSSDGKLVLYVDGELVGEVDSPAMGRWAAWPLLLGLSRSVEEKPAIVSVDEFRWFDRLLTAQEIELLSNWRSQEYDRNKDSDSDQLTNLGEFENRSMPVSFDSGDSKFQHIFSSSDTDGDQLTDKSEHPDNAPLIQALRFSPSIAEAGEESPPPRPAVSLAYSKDSDGDGLSDSEEFLGGVLTNGVLIGASLPMDGDTDLDWLDDYQETVWYDQYKPDSRDSDDSNLIFDGWEVYLGSTASIASGLQHGPLQDQDGDGISNKLEIAFDLNPFLRDGSGAQVISDADDDGLTDFEATYVFPASGEVPGTPSGFSYRDKVLNELRGGAVLTAGGDLDGDGVSDEVEISDGTNPRDSENASGWVTQGLLYRVLSEYEESLTQTVPSEILDAIGDGWVVLDQHKREISIEYEAGQKIRVRPVYGVDLHYDIASVPLLISYVANGGETKHTVIIPDELELVASPGHGMGNAESLVRHYQGPPMTPVLEDYAAAVVANPGSFEADPNTFKNQPYSNATMFKSRPYASFAPEGVGSGTLIVTVAPLVKPSLQNVPTPDEISPEDPSFGNNTETKERIIDNCPNCGQLPAPVQPGGAGGAGIVSRDPVYSFKYPPIKYIAFEPRWPVFYPRAEK